MPSSTSASRALRFALRAALFIGLALQVLLAAVLWGPPAAPSGYMGSTVLKNERLHAIASPKVVLVGGSNLTYGVDSERLEKALCAPVANMGLTAMLGFRFVAEEALAGTGQGDLLIVTLEHGTYRLPDPAPDALATVIDYHPRSIRFVPWRQRPRLVASLGVLHLQSLRDHCWHWITKGSAPGYTVREFLDNGDIVSHLDAPMGPIPEPEKAVFDTLVIDPAFWPMAEAFLARVREKGAQAVFTFPSMAQRIYDREVQQALKDSLLAHGMPVLGDPSDYVFADSLFYDSWFHLRRQGRAERTTRMIRDLCGAMPERCCTKEDEAREP